MREMIAEETLVEVKVAAESLLAVINGESDAGYRGDRRAVERG